MALRFFDCNCSLGRLAIPQPGSPGTTVELIAEMNYFGIERALVYHGTARDADPMAGNRLLLKDIADHDRRLASCWIVLPHHTDEMPRPEELVAEMCSAEVRAARIFPAKRGQHWSLSPWSAGPLCGALETARIPLFVGFDQITWDAIHRIASSHPALPIVVTGVRYEELRNIYPLLEALPNFHIDTSWIVVHFGLEDLVARFGAERFLFGTGLPAFSAGPALTHLLYAELVDREKALIASGNLERLLAAAHPSSGIPIEARA